MKSDKLKPVCVGLFQWGLFSAIFYCGSVGAQNTHVVPGKNEKCIINSSGKSVLPSGRYVTPVGEVTTVTRAPYGLAVSPNGEFGIVVHSNVVSLVQLKGKLAVERFPDFNGMGLDIIKGASFVGAEFIDNQTAIIGGGDKGILWFFDIVHKKVIDSIDVGLFHESHPHEAFLTDLKIDFKHQEIWVLDRGWKELLCIDLVKKTLKKRFSTGRIPLSLAISPDGNSVIFSHVGIYDYPVLPGVNESNGDSLFLKFPPYAAHTKEAEEGVEIEGRKIPGLGKSNDLESMSVWIYQRSQDKITKRIPLGLPIGEMLDELEVVGGSHPSAIVCDNSKAYIALTQQDAIALLDINKGKVLKMISIQTETVLDKYRGYFPYGLELDQKRGRIYAALLGFNSIASLDIRTGKTLGFLPTGWGATRVKFLINQNQLVVVSARGYGAGPNGGKSFVSPVQGTYVGDIQLGLLQRIDVSDDIIWASGRKRAIDNCMVVFDNEMIKPQMQVLDSKNTPIKHIVYITKENRTYDEVLGQLPQGNGDSTLARYGVNCGDILVNDFLKLTRQQLQKLGLDTFTADQIRSYYRGLDVTPNHYKIANEFCFSDNFYCDSDASIHGHHWMMGTIPNEYVETNSANAGSFKLFSPAAGRRFPRTTGAQDPEDYNQFGGLWEALQRNKISVYNFGEANEYTDVQEEWDDTMNGTAMPVPFPMPKAIYSGTSRMYPGYNTNIPDQFRVEKFEEEFTNKWLTGKDTMPTMITIQLPNDHTSSPRPQDGYFLPHSYVADNDLALGRMLQFLSHTPYWKNMLVIITEDDPQGGVDHIDAHRSLLLMAGPFVKRNSVSSMHANFGSIIHTMYHILGIAPVNQFDFTSTLLSEFFTDSPNFKPYQLEASDLRIFNPDIVMKRYNREVSWREVKMSESMDNELEIKKLSK